MSLRPIAILLAAAWLLAGCGLPDPYETYPPSTPAPPPPRAPDALTVTGATTTTPENELDFGEMRTPAEATPPAQPAPPAANPATNPAAGTQVAICYNRIWNSTEAVRSAALLACGKKSAPQIVSQDLDLNACPLMTPSHAVFACNAAP